MKKILTRVMFFIIIFLGTISITQSTNIVCEQGCTTLKSEWLYIDSIYCYKWCAGGHYKVSVDKHTWNINEANCTTEKKCTTCGYVAQEALGHQEGTAATCISRAKCGRCGSSYGNYIAHSYTNTCTETHCNQTNAICAYCNAHKGTCGGGCNNSGYCNHCAISHCTKCAHECTHMYTNCKDPHCNNIRYCIKCGHTHTVCNLNGTCPEAHCNAKICFACGGNHQGACGGGHIYEWVTDNNLSESQFHSNKCKYSGCTSENGLHAAIWGMADTNHTSTCKGCGLTYQHPIEWSIEQSGPTDLHPCMWKGGCSATHEPTWGAYYKVNGGVDGDNDGGPHTRKCSTCEVTEIYHTYTTEPWTWNTVSSHIRECITCHLKQIEQHNFIKYEKKQVDDVNHSELYKHWNICEKCDPARREADELHEDDGNGTCKKCGQTLWKVMCEGENITEAIKANATRKAKQQEIIKIVEVVDNNGTPQIKYIQQMIGPETIIANGSNELIINKNGKYTITTSGGAAVIEISNISKDLLIEKIITPSTATTDSVKITIRSSQVEEKYDKNIYIKEGKTSITQAELNSGSNPYEITKTVNQNGTYYFIAKDTAGNEKIIEVEIDNIVKGQTTVTIGNDVFINGYVFTEILINPEKSWRIEDINFTPYKVGSTSPIAVDKTKNLKIVKIMDMSRQVVGSVTGVNPPGSYYIQVAIGGSIFSEAQTYIIDLQSVVLDYADHLITGKNRILVEVRDLRDLT